MSNKIYSSIDPSLDPRHIYNNPRAYETAKKSFFVLTVEDEKLANFKRANSNNPGFFQTIDEINSDSSISDKTAYILGDRASDFLKLAVSRFPIPDYEVQSSEYRRGNLTVKMAGTAKFDGGDFTCHDYVGLETENILLAWKNAAFDLGTMSGGRMENYKLEAKVTEYTQDYKAVRTWNIHGMWLTKLDRGELDKTDEGTEVRDVTASFLYDWADEELSDEYDSLRADKIDTDNTIIG